jgi:hypothetical protein
VKDIPVKKLMSQRLKLLFKQRHSMKFQPAANGEKKRNKLAQKHMMLILMRNTQKMKLSIKRNDSLNIQTIYLNLIFQ